MARSRDVRVRHLPALVLAAAAAALVACSTPAPVPVGAGGPAGADGGLFAAPGSPWTTVLPADAPLDPRSAELVGRMTTEEPLVSVNGWTVPVYQAGPDTPRFAVRATEDYSPGWQLPSVPIPQGAEPDRKEDGHMVVVDRAGGCVYEMWQARRGDGGWSASWINATPTDGPGVYPAGLSARASGLSAAAGLIWPDELASGTIPHALLFAYPYTADGGPVAPATASDGETDDGPALPEGAHLRLDPSLDLATLDLPPDQLAIATALQRYGMILGDTSGGLTLYAVAPQSFDSFPYPKSWRGDTWAHLDKIPFDRMQVLALPSQDRQPTVVEPNRCNSGGHFRDG